jgi:Putative auto-transporter adhesin, head GIN domain
MKKLVSLLLVSVLAVNAYSQQLYNDANAQPRTLSGSFHAIKVSNAIDLYLSQGNEEGIAVSAISDEVRNKIKTVVENGVLKIYFESEGNWWKQSGNKRMRAYVSFKQLDKITASGASDVVVNGAIKANELDLNFSGASDFKGAITANELNVDISGASDITLGGGKVTSLKIVASGASDFKGYDLEADNCSVSASGASSIKVTVNNELNASASGASDIHYKGNGKIRDLKSSGASSVSRKG